MATIILLTLLFLCPSISMADKYDKNNYRPQNSSVTIDETNLPIVFIDTRDSSGNASIIHKDYAIVARMKVIANDDGINYGDTLAHAAQKTDYEGWVSLRYRGNSSFNDSEKKPFTIRTLETNDVEGPKKKVNIMGMPKDNKWVLIAPYIDRSQIRDVLMFQLARPYMEYVPRVRHCELILDGIYYGIYVMAEKPGKGKHRMNLEDPGISGDELTGGYHLEIDRDDEPNYYLSKHIMRDEYGRRYTYYYRTVFQYKHPDYDEMMPAHPEQLSYIQNQIDVMEQALESNDFADTLTGYRRYLDPMSFIDHQLSQEVSVNIDGYRLSTNIYKQRDSQDPHFKTTLWDFNLSFGNAKQMGGTLTNFWVYQNTYVNRNDFKVPFWWSRMMEDPNYVVQLKQRWAQYRQGAYSDQHLMAVIDSLVAHLEEKGALQRNNTAYTMFGGKEIWSVPNVNTVNTYEKEIDNMKRWLKERIAWMDEQLEYDETNMMVCNAYFAKQPIAYYSLSGTRLQEMPRKGIAIIKYKDGSCRKVIVE